MVVTEKVWLNHLIPKEQHCSLPSAMQADTHSLIRRFVIHSQARTLGDRDLMNEDRHGQFPGCYKAMDRADTKLVVT